MEHGWVFQTILLSIFTRLTPNPIFLRLGVYCALFRSHVVVGWGVWYGWVVTFRIFSLVTS